MTHYAVALGDSSCFQALQADNEDRQMPPCWPQSNELVERTVANPKAGTWKMHWSEWGVDRDTDHNRCQSSNPFIPPMNRVKGKRGA